MVVQAACASAAARKGFDHIHTAWRDLWVGELVRQGARRGLVESTGECWHTHDSPVPELTTGGGLGYRPAAFHAVKRQASAHYTFTLAHESAPLPGWVTEKTFQSLAVGSIPVFRGAPTNHTNHSRRPVRARLEIETLVPCDHCVIDASPGTALADPRALLDHLAHLLSPAGAPELAKLRAWRGQAYDPAAHPRFEALVRQGSVDTALCRVAALAKPGRYSGTCRGSCLEQTWALQTLGSHG